MATEEQLDATCRKLQSSRRDIFELVHVLKGDRPARDSHEGFPRSRIMRALTGKQGRNALGHAALALAISRPRTAWRLAGLAPLLRPMIIRYVAGRLFRPRNPVSTSSN
jgi:hypothetical protein